MPRNRLLLAFLGVLTFAALAFAPPPDAHAAARPFIDAHRGASADAPENTLAAFRLAAKMGTDMVEADVQRTKDGKLVVVHDATLKRTTNAESVYPERSPWRVGDFTLAEIQRLDAGSWQSDTHKGEPVPTLAAVLAEVRDTGVALMLEAKDPKLYPGIDEDIVAALRADPYWRHATSPDRLLLVSFDWTFQRELHDRAPDFPVGVIGTPSGSELDGLAKWADFVNPKHTDVDAALVRRIHGLGMATAPWTVDEADDMQRMIDCGVDGITTNRPDVLRDVRDGG